MGCRGDDVGWWGIEVRVLVVIYDLGEGVRGGSWERVGEVEIVVLEGERD